MGHQKAGRGEQWLKTGKRKNKPKEIKTPERIGTKEGRAGGVERDRQESKTRKHPGKQPRKKPRKQTRKQPREQPRKQPRKKRGKPRKKPGKQESKQIRKQKAESRK